MTKKRGKIPSLITGSNGKPSKVVCKRRRLCSRCSFEILLGESCFEIPKVGGGFSNKKTFCPDCFKEILEQTKKDMSILEDSIR